VTCLCESNIIHYLLFCALTSEKEKDKINNNEEFDPGSG
jgi:hypothetical protein